MSSGPTSLERAAQEVIDSDPARDSGGGVLGVPSEAHQLDLLRGNDGKLPSNVFQLMRENDRAEKARGPGRPKGSRNKRDENLAKLIAHKFGDPVEFQASIYAMPLDQLCELLLVADGTVERQERLDELMMDLAARVRELSKGNVLDDNRQSINRLADACEALESAAKARASAPGKVAIAALNLQLAAAARVSEYVHSKKPTDVKVDFDTIPTIVMAAPGAAGQDFDAADATTRLAGDMLARALRQGRIEAQDIVGLQFDGERFIQEGEFVEVDEDSTEDGEADE